MSKDKRTWVEVIAGENGSVWDRQAPIEGEYVRKDTDVGPNHSNMYYLKNDDGETGIWGSTVLDDKFQNIEVGQYIKIEPLGLVKGKSGKEYYDYALFYDDDAMPEDFLR